MSMDAKDVAIPMSSEIMPWNISTVIVDHPGVCRTMVDGKLVVDYENCSGCGGCLSSCHAAHAITLKQRVPR